MTTNKRFYSTAINKYLTEYWISKAVTLPDLDQAKENTLIFI